MSQTVADSGVIEVYEFVCRGTQKSTQYWNLLSSLKVLLVRKPCGLVQLSVSLVQLDCLVCWYV